MFANARQTLQKGLGVGHMTCSKARTVGTFFSKKSTLQAFSLSKFPKIQHSKRFRYQFFKNVNTPSVFHVGTEGIQSSCLRFLWAWATSMRRCPAQRDRDTYIHTVRYIESHRYTQRDADRQRETGTERDPHTDAHTHTQTQRPTSQT